MRPSAIQASGYVHISVSGTLSASSIIQGNGDVAISASTLNLAEVKSTGNKVYMTATGGNVTTGPITANGDSIQVIADSGTIKVNGAVTGTNLTQIFRAKGNISLQNVDNSNGDVRIFANQTASATTFNVGSGTTNGATYIHNNGSSGYTTYISNGPGAGGITVSSSTGLQVNASSGPTGTIILDGKANGKVTLSSNITVDGAAGSGSISIFAPEVIANGATLNANSPGQQVGGIALTTNKITDNSGLILNINGNGPFSGFVNLSITPVDSWSVTASSNPAQPITFGAFTGSSNPLTITGSGDFEINANGNNNGLKIWGPSLTISTASTKITQQGGGNGIAISAWDGGIKQQFFCKFG